MTRTTRTTLRRLAGPLLALATVASGALVLGQPAVAGAAVTSHVTPAAAAAGGFSFKTHDDDHDTTFNQLLSINDNGAIAGYFGSGTPATTHPNKGYVLRGPYGQANYANENFPGSQQTQVTGINVSGTTCGFYADAAGDNFGFVLKNGIWTVVIDPHTTGTTNQLLGLNDNGIAVGFYTDHKGNAHGYEFNFHTDTFSPVNIPGASSVTATGINQAGDVSGFYVNAKGSTVAFLRRGHTITSFSAPGSTNTMALGVNSSDEIVGAYAGSGTSTHGFIWSKGTLRTVDDPNGIDTTTINGLNDKGDIVGFYSVGSIVHGFLGIAS
jgi:hypothetical protein